MSVRYAYALARVVVIGAFAAWSGAAAADDASPQPSSIALPNSHTLPAGVNSLTPEPFGNAVTRIRGSLLEKWNTAQTDLRIDIDILAACRAQPDACESIAAQRIIAIVDGAQRREGRARIGEINRAVNLAIAATSDTTQYGVEDKWASPLMTFTSGRGDCEDYALAKYAALRAAGFAQDDLRLLIVRLRKPIMPSFPCGTRAAGSFSITGALRCWMRRILTPRRSLLCVKTTCRSCQRRP